MSLDRRNFIKSGIMAGGALVFPATKAISQSYSDSFSHLKPVTENAVPITVEERQSRIEKARKLMRENKIDAMVLEAGTSLFYFAGIEWWRSERMFGMILPVNGEPAYICPAFEEERAREKILFGDDVRVWQEHESPYNLVKQFLQERNLSAGQIAFEEATRFFVYDGIRKQLPSAGFTSADPVSAGCRMIKSPAELALMQLANNGVIEAYKTVFENVKAGMTQYDLDEQFSAAFDAVGIKGGAGAQLGEYTAYPHGSIKPQYLKEGDVILVDGVGSVQGYRGDISRTFVFGEPTKVQRERWDLNKKAQDAAYAAIKPGVACEEIDAAARRVINDAGYGPGYNNFFHRVGHGIGLDTHEWTYLVKGNKTPLQPGMCFSNEPGIYVYGEFGTRLEDCFYVTEDGYQSFTKQSISIDQPFG